MHSHFRVVASIINCFGSRRVNSAFRHVNCLRDPLTIQSQRGTARKDPFFELHRKQFVRIDRPLPTSPTRYKAAKMCTGTFYLYTCPHTGWVKSADCGQGWRCAGRGGPSVRVAIPCARCQARGVRALGESGRWGRKRERSAVVQRSDGSDC